MQTRVWRVVLSISTLCCDPLRSSNFPLSTKPQIKNEVPYIYTSPGGKNIGPCILGVTAGLWCQRTKDPAPIPCSECDVPLLQIQFFANISQSMKPTEKIVEVENVSREISYKKGHSPVSLDLPFNLEIYKFKSMKFEIFNVFTFSATLLQISPDLWGLGEEL